MEIIDAKQEIVRVVHTYQNLVFSICLKMTGDYFVAEDLAQETFVRAYANWSQFDGKNEKAWICRIASNQCVDYLRAAARKEQALGEDYFQEEMAPQKEEPLTVYMNKEVMKGVEDACLRLKEPYASIAKMYILQGLTVNEIAIKSGKNRKTIQTQIYRARSLLKKMIGKEEVEG